jgi:hypothetical protein
VAPRIQFWCNARIPKQSVGGSPGKVYNGCQE